MNIDPVSENICLANVIIRLREKVETLQRENSSLKEALAKGAVQNFVSSLPISTQGAIKKFVTILETYFASVMGATPGDTQTQSNLKSGSSESSGKERLMICPVCDSEDCGWWRSRPKDESPLSIAAMAIEHPDVCPICGHESGDCMWWGMKKNPIKTGGIKCK